MSKAFTSEEGADAPPLVPPRAPLPDGVPNYVTERGMRQLREEMTALLAERVGIERDLEGVDRTHALASLAARRFELETRIASAEVVPMPTATTDVVRFGARVRVDGEDGLREYEIVGVDEADAGQGRIAFVSPIARALLGCSVGDSVRLRAPRGEEELEILGVTYDGA